MLQYSRREVKCSKFAHKGSSRNIQDSDTDDELPGPMDSIGSSTDDEPSYQTSVPDISNQKKQFFGDLLNEAVRASSCLSQLVKEDKRRMVGSGAPQRGSAAAAASMRRRKPSGSSSGGGASGGATGSMLQQHVSRRQIS
ncbi:unnamed protein product [Eruca vesicaria subsp. sativa]|uniref:Uncharacterized protein n=1 Tax=Eruca vesicaria subsp. sativa TaxID=29727 RepID=A0ABC8LY79_ERUVS|nr:unnamed protein product [Eruca vesicaria subsp. sativa]